MEIPEPGDYCEYYPKNFTKLGISMLNAARYKLY